MSKATTDLDKKLRLAILVQVRLTAFSKLKNRVFIKSKYRFFEVPLSKIKEGFKNYPYKDVD